MATLAKLLQLFGLVSRYRINASKSLIIGLNVPAEIKDQVGVTVTAPWGTRVKYLGVWLTDSLDSSELLDLNFVPVLKSVQQQLVQWAKLKLSWFGRIAALQMKILPRFIFLFRNLILPISTKVLSKVQCLFNEFIWDQKKSRIKISLLQKSKEEGGIVVPNVLLYYQAAVLEYLAQWWDLTGKISW